MDADADLPDEVRDPKFIAKLADNVKEGKALEKQLEREEKLPTEAQKKKLRSEEKIFIN